MINIDSIFDTLILQLPGLSPHYTNHPLFPDMVSSAIVAAMIAIGLNMAMALLRRKTTNIEKMKTVMKETGEWRKKYTEAIKKKDKALIDDLKKKQAQMNKMNLEMQQQQMRPMMLYMIPSFMLWIFVFPSIFGQTVALSPLTIPYISCSDANVKTDNPPQITNNTHSNQIIKGPCKIPGQVFLWGWFLLVNFAFSGIISKVTNTSIPTF